MKLPFFDNIIWHSLNGPHAKFSSGTTEVRRYAEGFPQIIGVADLVHPELSALTPYCKVGEHFYCLGWSGPVPSDWKIDVEVPVHQLVWNDPAPAADDKIAVVRLGIDDVPQMIELVDLTQPGPFGPRAIELGEYYGVFEGGRLVAMAGNRLKVGSLIEICSVCTHPDFQGRGLARELVKALIRFAIQRDQITFLHVADYDAHALDIYRRMGFFHYQDVVGRIITPA